MLNKLISEDGARGSAPRRGGRRKVRGHGSDRNDDGNRLIAAAGAKNGDSGENDTEGVVMAGFRCSSKKKICNTRNYFKRDRSCSSVTRVIDGVPWFFLSL